MSTVTTFAADEQSRVGAEQVFLDRVLPAVKKHARFVFRHLKRELRAEKIAECVALAWAWVVRLVEQGKDVASFPSALATFAARHVNAGRSLCGQESAKDVLSHARHGSSVQRFTPIDAEWREALIYDMQTSPSNAAAFRIDFPDWLATLGERNRRIVTDLALGHSTERTAHKFAVSPGRISQLRGEYHQSWNQFHNE